MTASGAEAPAYSLESFAAKAPADSLKSFAAEALADSLERFVKKRRDRFGERKRNNKEG